MQPQPPARRRGRPRPAVSAAAPAIAIAIAASRAAVIGILLAATVLGFACRPATASVAIGSPAPGFRLVDATGATHTLEQYRGRTVVLEWINPHCPFSRRQAVEKVMVETSARFPAAVWLAVNSTARAHGDYVEPSRHLAWNAEHGIGYPVLYDTAGDVGRAYGAQTTPHMFVIDAQGVLVYQGAIDDDPPGRRPKAERSNFVAAALAAHAAGRPIERTTTKPYGCTVKYAD